MRLGHWITDDPRLQVCADGCSIDTSSERTREVLLPAGTRRVALLSRDWIPAHTRIAEADGRRLGVAIGGVRLDGRAVELDDPRLGAGWHDPEGDWRWTDGNGELDVQGCHELQFTIVMTGSYWRDADKLVAAGSRAGRARHVR
jgi:hypothetical protein